jgi:hypothetical protein
VKIPRTIGLAVIAALALMAVAGVSSAAARTVICKTAETACSEANTYGSGTSLKAASTAVTITTSLDAISCTASALEGETTAVSGEPLPATFSGWSLESCQRNEKACTTGSAEHLPYSASITSVGGGNGTVALKGSGGEVGWLVKCGSFINCTFSFQPTLTAEGGSSAHLSVDQAMNRSGEICPKSATFAATYTVSSPQVVYVSQPPAFKQISRLEGAASVLCKAAESLCTSGNIYPSGTEVKATLTPGTTATVRMPLVNLTCDSSLAAHTTAELGQDFVPASVTSFSLSKCQAPDGKSCTVSAQSLPYASEFGWMTEVHPMMSIEGVRFTFQCSYVECVIGFGEARLSMTDGAPATLFLNDTATYESGSLCPGFSVFEAKYDVTSPSPLVLSNLYS